MKNKSQLLDDLAQMANGAAGIAGSLQQQIRQDVKARIDEMASKMDLVPREDFERLEAQIMALQERLEKLEGQKK